MASPRCQEAVVDRLSTGHSVRRICRILGIRRQSYYRRKSGHRKEEQDAQVGQLLRQVATKYIAWGFRKVFHYLRNQGYGYNHKRMYRIWKAEGLNLRQATKRKRLYRRYRRLLAPKTINEGWAMDFVSDWVGGHRHQPVRVFNLMDEGSRRALYTKAHQRIGADQVVAILEQQVALRGKPRYIRVDNGPEFISQRLQTWAQQQGIELYYIQAGKPSQNGLIERLNKTLRVECLNLSWFDSLTELNRALMNWRKVYNTLRPHQSLNFQAPNTFEIKHSQLYYKLVAV